MIADWVIVDSAHDTTIPARGKALVDTNISIAVPAGTCELGNWAWEFGRKLMRLVDGRIAPRSGLAVKSFIDTGAGVIDADYRGQVKVLLFNHAGKDFEGKVSIGDDRAVWMLI